MTLKRLFLIVCIVHFALVTQAQENTIDKRDPVAMLQASFIFNFANLSEWPAYSQKSTDFVIGIYGNEAIYDHMLLKYATQPMGKQIVKIKKIENLSDVSNVQILFIDDSKMGDIHRIARLLQNTVSIIVTESPGALELGATFNFVVENSNMRYELNMKKIRKKGINISSRLKEWAVKLIE